MSTGRPCPLVEKGKGVLDAAKSVDHLRRQAAPRNNALAADEHGMPMGSRLARTYSALSKAENGV